MCNVKEDVCKARMAKVIEVDKNLTKYKEQQLETIKEKALLDKNLSVLITKLEDLKEDMGELKKEIENLKKPKNMNPILLGIIIAVGSTITGAIIMEILKQTF